MIPLLDEETTIPALFGCLEALQTPPTFEVILVDGGSGDRTVERLGETGARLSRRGVATRLLTAPGAGRAVQLNHGARVGRGEALLFLHADTCLPSGSLGAVETALLDPRVVGGGFRHRFSGRGMLLRMISLYATTRSLLRGVHYGDQAMFVRRTVFETIGGFREVPLFEDLELSRAMRAQGRVVTLPLAATTSARRLTRGGTLRTAARFSWLKIRYALGADVRALAREYGNIRDGSRQLPSGSEQ